MKIEEIDRNFELKSTMGENDIIWTDIRRLPVDVYGLYNWRKEPVFRRMPEDIAEQTNPGVYGLHTNTAGGRLRFATDSPYIAVHAVYNGLGHMPHMAYTGSAGFDLYIDKEDGTSTFKGSFIPPTENDSTEYESILYPGEGLRAYTIGFPLYSGVESVCIGLKKGSVIDKGLPYLPKKPIVYYGSSITQGGCASRPGNCYQAIVCRKTNTDYINLGFSGSARGEAVIAEYISGLDMSLFVLDYDHNAPDVDHLQKTHAPFFDIVRKANPTLPIIILSKPDFDSDSVENAKRRAIVKATYDNAVATGDKNVYYIDGESLFGSDGRDGCTVDGCHPDDLGFYRFAERLLVCIKENNI